MKSSRWLAAGLCFLCQCTGTETGNPVHGDHAQLALAARSPTVAQQGLAGVRFERVSILLAALALEPCDGSAPTLLFQDDEVELFGGELRDVAIPAGTYCALLVRMGDGADSFAASRMVNRGQTTLTFESQLRVRARLELSEPLATSGAHSRWILSVDLATWLDAIESWLERGDALLSLDDPETMALRHAQARSLQLFEDVDGDGQLDSVELDSTLSEAGVLLR